MIYFIIITLVIIILLLIYNYEYFTSVSYIGGNRLKNVVSDGDHYADYTAEFEKKQGEFLRRYYLLSQ